MKHALKTIIKDKIYDSMKKKIKNQFYTFLMNESPHRVNKIARAKKKHTKRSVARSYQHAKNKQNQQKNFDWMN